MKTFEVLGRAADYIDEHGWCQRVLRTHDGRVCLRGAMYAVLSEMAHPNYANVTARTKAVDEACCVLRESLRVCCLGTRTATVLSVTGWNDEVGRRKEEVTKALRRATAACATRELLNGKPAEFCLPPAPKQEGVTWNKIK